MLRDRSGNAKEAFEKLREQKRSVYNSWDVTDEDVSRLRSSVSSMLELRLIDDWATHRKMLSSWTKLLSNDGSNQVSKLLPTRRPMSKGKAKRLKKIWKMFKSSKHPQTELEETEMSK